MHLWWEIACSLENNSLQQLNCSLWAHTFIDVKLLLSTVWFLLTPGSKSGQVLLLQTPLISMISRIIFSIEVAWLLCLICAARGLRGEILSGVLPWPLSPRTLQGAEHRSLPWKSGSRVWDRGSWGLGGSCSPLWDLGVAVGWARTQVPLLLALQSGDSSRPQREGFAVSHKGQGLPTGLEPFKCGKEVSRLGSWLRQSVLVTLVSAGWGLHPSTSVTFSTEPRSHRRISSHPAPASQTDQWHRATCLAAS